MIILVLSASRRTVETSWLAQNFGFSIDMTNQSNLNLAVSSKQVLEVGSLMIGH
jgi:hypothetical protein